MMKAYPQQNVALNKLVYNHDHNRPWRISEDLFDNFADRWEIYFTTNSIKTRSSLELGFIYISPSQHFD